MQHGNEQTTKLESREGTKEAKPINARKKKQAQWHEREINEGKKTDR